jgi:divalent metal cation (Fe/Co/Zn/Cd) transporter
MQMSPVTTLLLASAVGVAGAVAVVIFDSVIADVVAGAVAFAALAVVMRSAVQLAGGAATPDDDTASKHP